MKPSEALYGPLAGRGLSAAAACLAAICATSACAQTGPSATTTATPAAGSNPLGLSIHHATLGVASIATEKAFFHDILGFEIGPFRKRPTYDHQQMLLPGFRIDMIEQKGSQRPAQTMGTDKQGWLHLAFEIKDAKTLYGALKAKGANVTPGRVEGDKMGSVIVTDPEGNRLELAEP